MERDFRSGAFRAWREVEIAEVTQVKQRSPICCTKGDKVLGEDHIE